MVECEPLIILNVTSIVYTTNVAVVKDRLQYRQSNVGCIMQKGPLCPESVSYQKKDKRSQFKKKKKI